MKLCILLLVAAARGLQAVSNFTNSSSSNPEPVNLGTAANFAVVAGAGITSSGVVGTIINGNMALYPGTAVSGFPPAVCTGAIEIANPTGLQAQSDLTIAYNDVQGRS